MNYSLGLFNGGICGLELGPVFMNNAEIHQGKGSMVSGSQSGHTPGSSLFLNPDLGLFTHKLINL